MTWKLTTEEIVKYWELIKYGVNQVEKPSNPETYFIGYLKELLLGNLICAFLMDEKRTIKMMLVCKVTEGFGKERSLVLLTIYGFIPTTDHEKAEGWTFLMKFAKNKEVSWIIAQPSHQRIEQLTAMLGFEKVHDVYRLKIGE